MLSALLKALAQLADPKLRRVFWLSLGGSLAVAALLALTAGWLLTLTQFVTLGWLEAMLDIAGALATALVIAVLFPGLVGVVSGLLLEDVARAVEARHYPDLAPARAQPITEAVMVALAFAAAMLTLNLLALPFYLLPGVNVIIFFTINGYLLGREYFEFVALRRLAPAAARKMRKEHRLRVLFAGFAIVLFAMVPLLNLLLPLFGAAFMVHVFERLRQQPKSV